MALDALQLRKKRRMPMEYTRGHAVEQLPAVDRQLLISEEPWNWLLIDPRTPSSFPYKYGRDRWQRTWRKPAVSGGSYIAPPQFTFRYHPHVLHQKVDQKISKMPITIGWCQ